MTEDFLALALNAERHSHAREDADYPQFHVAPPVGRLNDPNGLIKVDDTYHAFFQYTPEHPKKLVYWGHAMSKNLVNWEYLEPAILPEQSPGRKRRLLRYCDRDRRRSGTLVHGQLQGSADR